MVRCASCGAETSPGLVCAACGVALAAGARPIAPQPTGAVPRWLWIALFVVAGFLTLSGVAFAASTPVAEPAHLVPFVAAAVVAAGAIGIQRGAVWGWAIAWAVVGAGNLYAVWGLMRGFSSGIVGLALWGALAATLLRGDVRAHCRVPSFRLQPSR